MGLSFPDQQFEALEFPAVTKQSPGETSSDEGSFDNAILFNDVMCGSSSSAHFYGDDPSMTAESTVDQSMEAWSSSTEVPEATPSHQDMGFLSNVDIIGLMEEYFPSPSFEPMTKFQPFSFWTTDELNGMNSDLFDFDFDYGHYEPVDHKDKGQSGNNGCYLTDPSRVSVEHAYAVRNESKKKPYADAPHMQMARTNKPKPNFHAYRDMETSEMVVASTSTYEPDAQMDIENNLDIIQVDDENEPDVQIDVENDDDDDNSDYYDDDDDDDEESLDDNSDYCDDDEENIPPRNCRSRWLSPKQLAKNVPEEKLVSHRLIALAQKKKQKRLVPREKKRRANNDEENIPPRSRRSRRPALTEEEKRLAKNSQEQRRRFELTELMEDLKKAMRLDKGVAKKMSRRDTLKHAIQIAKALKTREDLKERLQELSGDLV